MPTDLGADAAGKQPLGQDAGQDDRQASRLVKPKIPVSAAGPPGNRATGEATQASGGKVGTAAGRRPRRGEARHLAHRRRHRKSKIAPAADATSRRPRRSGAGGQRRGKCAPT